MYKAKSKERVRAVTDLPILCLLCDARVAHAGITWGLNEVHHLFALSCVVFV